MLTLGIETSCDDTGLALVGEGGLIAARLASQDRVHGLFGGVVPELASREHLRALGPLFADLMAASGLGVEAIDCVAVARGPGLLGSLLVGLGLAKGLCLALGCRLVGVDHLKAHLLAAGLEGELLFPAVGLLVSGGHTHLYRIESPLTFTLLGRTLDDAAGEALDKAAKLVNLPYPGGRHIDALAALAEPDKGLFPRPYLDNQNLDFSFSGLKTAVAQHVRANPGLTLTAMPEPERLSGRPGDFAGLSVFCASLLYSLAETLRVKTTRALAANPDVRSLIVAGGVAANSRIRRVMGDLARERGLALTLPSPGLCADNAAMIAYAGRTIALAGLGHGLDLEAVPRGTPVPGDLRPVD